MKIQKVNENYVLTDVPYENHRRGKNYACLILGLDTKYGLKRQFLGKVELSSGVAYAFKEKPIAGQIIEVEAIYYSGSGRPSPYEASGFYEIQKDGSLVKKTKEEVLSSFESIENVEL